MHLMSKCAKYEEEMPCKTDMYLWKPNHLACFRKHFFTSILDEIFITILHHFAEERAERRRERKIIEEKPDESVIKVIFGTDFGLGQ